MKRSRTAWFGLCTMAVLVSTAMHLVAAEAPPQDYAQLKREAEGLIADGSYARARDLYEHAAGAFDLTADQRRWVNFRVADTTWRAEASTQQHDDTIFQRATKALKALIDVIERPEDRDLVWAEAQESLGDFHWDRNRGRNWGGGWQHYQHALDWWAGSRDVQTARTRYLELVWKIAEPRWANRSYFSPGHVPINIAENAARIAASELDQARTQVLLAETLRNNGGWQYWYRAQQAYEEAIAYGKTNEWYDDALYHYAEMLAHQGRVIETPSGGWQTQPDYVRAVELFRKLTTEFDKGRTPYWDQAKAQINSITSPQVSASVSNIFLPGSVVSINLSYRNVENVEIALTQVDLTRHVQPRQRDASLYGWLQDVDLNQGRRMRSMQHDTKDTGEHHWGSHMLNFEEPLEVGAYVLTARGGGQNARALVLVTDVSIVSKNWDDQTLVYACDAIDGSPVPNARVRVWTYRVHDHKWVGSNSIEQTDNEGLAAVKLNAHQGRGGYQGHLIFVEQDGRQAFAIASSQLFGGWGQSWRIYATSDRPAYRPEEIVQWRITARSNDGSGYSTPANHRLEYEIHGPRGKVDEGEVTLNEFGAAWGELDLDTSMALGEYSIQMKDGSNSRHLGGATLFRIEEYKLPEFEVIVQTPKEDDGRQKSFRTGESVEATIQASYYFGGPVANATVEVVVHQQPFYHWWRRPVRYPWYYEQQDQWWRYWGGQVIKQETLTTDDEGRATVRFDTPQGGDSFEYRIEARVTDSSRREITGNGSVRVTPQRYYVHPYAEHHIYMPGDTVETHIEAMDANDQPVSVEGEIIITRETWTEIWINPRGEEVTGTALERAKRSVTSFPPPATSGQPWVLKHRGYTSELIEKTTAKTDDEGKATVSFTPKKVGYYRIRWRSHDEQSPGSPPITADTTVWVTDEETNYLGYHQSGVEIIVDRESFRAGNTAPIMLSVPANNRWVLFGVEGDDLHDYQLVHVTGTVKLIHVPIDTRHIPNVFLHATMVQDGQMHVDQERIVVPPVEQFLEVEVVADQDVYEPREHGALTVITRDVDGNPVSAEVSLGLVDESVYYIQQDYAGDPRKFFYERQQYQRVQTASTMQQMGYARLIEVDEGQIVDERYWSQLKEEEKAAAISGPRLAGGVGGGGGFEDMEGLAVDGLAARESMRALGSSRRRSMNMPAPASAAMPMESSMEDMSVASQAIAPPVGGAGVDGQGQGPDIVVRSDFRSTIVWTPSVITDEDGTAIVEFDFADSTTRYKAIARAIDTGTRVGIGEAQARTRQPLIARLQAPRFFVVGDVVTISGVFNNNTDEPMTIQPELETTRLRIDTPMRDGRPVETMAPLTIPANSEARADWLCSVIEPGEETITLAGRGSEHGDAMQLSYTIHEHGIERVITQAGKVRGEAVTIALDLPADRDRESTELTVQVTPSMAVTMLDALPYLVDYPYGCTEQTMSRFLPAAITAKTLRDMGLSPEEALGKVFGGIERQFVDKTHPAERENPENIRRLTEITQASLTRLYDFQHSDGGWGWWKQGNSDHFMSAYVLWGLSLGQQAELDVRRDVLDRAAKYLQLEIIEQEGNPSMQSWMLHALATYRVATEQAGQSEYEERAVRTLWNDHIDLNAYGRALFAIALHHYGDGDRARILVRNLENGVKRDDTPDTSILLGSGQQSQPAVIGTAHWGADGVAWRWHDSAVESTAWALQAMLLIEPDHELIEPVTNWLIKNRRGAQWSNTRDTAMTVLAMNAYLKQSGELQPELTYRLIVNGQQVQEQTVTAEQAISAPSRFAIDRSLLRDGRNDIRIERDGRGPIYFAASASFFSHEEPVPAGGHEIFVRRDYYKLVPRQTLLKGIVYEREPVMDGDYITSGERVEVVLTIEAKNDYEYLVFEDLKPAGLEAVQIRSGASMNVRELKSSAIDRKFGEGRADGAIGQDVRQPGVRPWSDYTGRSRWVHQELRDRKVALFVDRMGEGTWELRYDMRAEVPGQFHALPVLGHAMYVPEIRCNSAEIRITVQDR